MHRTPIGVIAATIISGVLLLGGVIMFFATSPTGAASFGWFAYQPLAGAAFFPGSLVVLTPLMATAAVIGIVGLLGFGATVGYVLGRRRPAM
jgi:heme/copper-type cytochrome/quinol oxidase subunit 1